MSEKQQRAARKERRGQPAPPPKYNLHESTATKALCESGLRAHSWKTLARGMYGNKRRERICKNCGKEATLTSWRLWLTAALVALTLAACAQPLRPESFLLVRVDSDRAWVLTIGQDTLRGTSSAPSFLCQFPDGLADSVKLWKTARLGSARLMIYDEKGRVLFGDTVYTEQDTARAWLP